jgi:murein DD-endopeptidase MepM/ murein hydrolase activator NlpD
MQAEWSSSVPWRQLRVGFPIRPKQGEVAQMLGHHRGGFGWSRGDWVSQRAFGVRFHRGVDCIGWVDARGREHTLAGAECLAPYDARVEYVEIDEDGQPSVLLRHSTLGQGRFRISFFGDLSELFVKAGQRVDRGEPIGSPGRTAAGLRFFHFGIGYRIRRPHVSDRFVDPFKHMPGRRARP